MLNIKSTLGALSCALLLVSCGGKEPVSSLSSLEGQEMNIFEEKVSLVTENFNWKVGSSKISGSWIYNKEVPPQAIITLQHGFMRKRTNMYDLANQYAQKGFAVFLTDLSTNQMNSTSFAKEYMKALLGGLPPLQKQPLPEPLLVSGHSLGGLFASFLLKEAQDLEALRVKGAVLLDPVDKNGNMDKTFQSLKKPESIYGILGQPSSCNSQSNATKPFQKLPQEFLGIRLKGGSHCDAEGKTSNWKCSMMCGSSSPINIQNLQTFATSWALSLLEGGQEPYFPQGEVYENLLLEGRFQSIR